VERREVTMQKKKFLITVTAIFTIFLFGLAPAAAELITTTVSGTVTAINAGNIVGYGVDDRIELFSVTYDDEGEVMHTYRSDGYIIATYYISSYPSYISIALR